jgi:hypothetical protein
LANLPEQVRVTYPHHELAGADLELHGWQHIDGEIHLRVTLTDHSIGCLPISWTSLLDDLGLEAPALLLSPASVRALRKMLAPLVGRQRRPGRRPQVRK